MTKDDFITQLTFMTKEEIHEYIKNNGKGPKPVKFYRIRSDNKKLSE